MKKWSFQAKLVAAFMLVITVVLVAVKYEPTAAL